MQCHDIASSLIQCLFIVVCLLAVGIGMKITFSFFDQLMEILFAMGLFILTYVRSSDLCLLVVVCIYLQSEQSKRVHFLPDTSRAFRLSCNAVLIQTLTGQFLKAYC